MPLRLSLSETNQKRPLIGPPLRSALHALDDRMEMDARGTLIANTIYSDCTRIAGIKRAIVRGLSSIQPLSALMAYSTFFKLKERI